MKKIVVVPCRGNGSRIRGYRKDGCKALIDVAGVPAIVRQMWMAEEAGAGFVVCVLPEHRRDVQKELGTTVTVSNSPLQPLDGPVLSMRRALDPVFSMGCRDAQVTMLFSDTLLRPEASFADLCRPNSTVIQRVENGSRYLNVRTYPDGCVQTWIDHPDDTSPALATIGIYTLPATVWRRVLEAELAAGNFTSYRFFEGLEMSTEWTRDWLDIGSESGYREACKVFAEADRRKERW